MLLISRERVCCGWWETDTFHVARQSLQQLYLQDTHAMSSLVVFYIAEATPATPAKSLMPTVQHSVLCETRDGILDGPKVLSRESYFHCSNTIKPILYRHTEWLWLPGCAKDWYWSSNCIS